MRSMRMCALWILLQREPGWRGGGHSLVKRRRGCMQNASAHERKGHLALTWGDAPSAVRRLLKTKVGQYRSNELKQTEVRACLQSTCDMRPNRAPALRELARARTTSL